ncbi:MAG: flippase [Myxococcales bacterium]|nr:flippase [Myxococcales bacterium]
MSQDDATEPEPSAEEAGERLHQKAASGASVTLVAHMAGRGLAFVFRVLATRVLGADGYGVLALAIAASNLAGRLGALGFDRVALRFGAEGHGRKDLAEAGRVWRLSLVTSFVGATVLGAVVWVFAAEIAEYFHEPDLVTPLRITAVSVPFIALTNTATAALQSVQRIVLMVLYLFVLPPLIAVVVLAIAEVGGWGDATWAAVALGVGWAVAGVGAAVSTLRASRGAGRPILRGPMVRYAATVVLVTGTAQIVWYIDRFMIGRMRTTADVGTYDVAANLAMQIAGVLAALAPTFTAMVGSLFFAEEKSQLQSLYQTSTRWAVALTLPMFLAVCFASEPMLRLFGPEFGAARWVLVVLAAGQLVNTAAGSVGQVLMMTNHERLVFLNNALVGGVNVVGNYWLIPRYGILGAALSTSGALSLMNLVAVAELWAIHRLQPISRAWIRPLGSALVGGGVGLGLWLVLPDGWIGEVVAATGAVLGYGLVMFRLGLVPEDEAVVGPLVRKLRRLTGRG